MTKTPLAIAAAAALALTASVALTDAAEARDQIRIVGSSTVYPFATAVAEEFGKTTDNKTPVVESTGSGGGLKLFCAGVGIDHPDITNASRRIKLSEVDRCAENGVTDITEVKIGFDGFSCSPTRRRPSRSRSPCSSSSSHWPRTCLRTAGWWRIPIRPGPTSTRRCQRSRSRPGDPARPAADLGHARRLRRARHGGRLQDLPRFIKALKKQDKKAYKVLCHSIREDGAFVEAGENDNLIVQKLKANPGALGIFGYSFLDQNRDKVQGSTINGVEPDFDTIADGSYPVSRSMYFYVKKAHVGVIPGIEEYIATFTDEDAWGPYGYLADKGLIPLPDADREAMRAQATAFAQLSM